MAPAVGDILEVTTHGTLLGEQVACVWHYRLDTPGAAVDYVDIVDNLAKLTTAMRGIMSGYATINGIIIKNVTNGLDEAIRAYAPVLSGTQPGDVQNRFTAWGFRLIRSTRATAHGSKRIWGVGEATTLEGAPTGAMVATLDAAAAVFGAPLVHDVADPANEHTLVPVIYGEALPSRPKKGGGTLPPRPATVNEVSGAIFTRITTQNSRKGY